MRYYNPCIFTSLYFSLVAVAVLESSPDSVLTPVYNSRDFTLSAVGSGNERMLRWEGVDDLFTLETNNTVIGDFSYGQKEAFKQSCKWRMPGEKTGCEEVKKYNGQYKVVVMATAGGTVTREEKIVTVNVQCKSTFSRTKITTSVCCLQSYHISFISHIQTFP